MISLLLLRRRSTAAFALGLSIASHALPARATEQASALAPAPAESATRAASINWRSDRVTAPDGTAVALLWATPVGHGPFPVVAFFHGAPGGIGEPGLLRFAQSSRWVEFIAAGYAVCLGDYRGHPEGQPFAVLRGEVNATDDVAAIVRFLSQQPALDPARLSVIGGSLGGVTTLQAVSQGKIGPRSIVLNAPASFPFLGVRGPRNRGAELTEENIDKPGALARIKSINCPVLIVQGTADTLTPINRLLHALLVESGKDATLELFENENHSFTNGPDTPAYRRALARSLEFIGRHTAPAPDARAAGNVRDFKLEGESWTAEVDGQPLAGILVKPAGSGPFPAILLSHGLGGSAQGLLGRARDYAAAGFVCIATDYTHAGQGKARNPDNAYSPENIRRASACLDVLASLPEVDARSICAWGFSMGAILSTGLAADRPERLAAVALMAGGIQENPTRLYASVGKARSIRTPFLILHGDADERVVPESSALLKQVLDESGVVNERIVFPGVDHTGIARHPEAQARVLEWFKRFTHRSGS